MGGMRDNAAWEAGREAGGDGFWCLRLKNFAGRLRRLSMRPSRHPRKERSRFIGYRSLVSSHWEREVHRDRDRYRNRDRMLGGREERQGGAKGGGASPPVG